MIRCMLGHVDLLLHLPDSQLMDEVELVDLDSDKWKEIV